MELKEFVAETLKEIIDGVVEAQNHAVKKSAKINPAGLKYMGHSQSFGVAYAHDVTTPPLAQLIEFDIAVTVFESGQAKAGLGVFAGALGVEHKPKREQKIPQLIGLSFLYR